MPDYQPQGFETLTEARLWGKRFVEWYNKEYRHSGVQYVTPKRQRGSGTEKKGLRRSKEKYPERWAREIREWSFSEEEWLNPKQEKETKTEAKAT